MDAGKCLDIRQYEKAMKERVQRLEAEAQALIAKGFRVEELVIVQREGYPDQVMPRSSIPVFKTALPVTIRPTGFSL